MTMQKIKAPPPHVAVEDSLVYLLLPQMKERGLHKHRTVVNFGSVGYYFDCLNRILSPFICNAVLKTHSGL